jgi:clan AA aspartic protease
LIVFDKSGRQHAMSGLVDTGFNGWLTLPPAIIASLGLSWHKEAYGVLAEGRSTLFNAFNAEILWDGQKKSVYVGELGSDTLIGMRLLDGFRLTMETTDGGPVQIERL